MKHKFNVIDVSKLTYPIFLLFLNVLNVSYYKC